MDGLDAELARLSREGWVVRPPVGRRRGPPERLDDEEPMTTPEFLERMGFEPAPDRRRKR
jgi:hypothetical protein